MMATSNFQIKGKEKWTSVWFRDPLPFDIIGEASMHADWDGIRLEQPDCTIFVPSSNVLAIVEIPPQD